MPLSAFLELRVVDRGTAPQPVISSSPVAENGIISGPVPLTVSFDSSSSQDANDDIVAIKWDFDGDGNVDQEGERVSFTYTELGSYVATLTLEDAAGNENSASVNINVGEQGIMAILQTDTIAGEVPLIVNFDASASTYNEGSIVSYEYDFGDGTEPFIGGSKLSFRYMEVGTYQAEVTVVGDDGSRDSQSIQIVVRPVALSSCFTVNTDSASAPLFLSVDPSCSKGTIDAYQWDFGDGDISFDRKPDVHEYTEPGIYTVTLQISSPEGIVDSFTKDIEVK